MPDASITIPERRATLVGEVEAACGALHVNYESPERLLIRATLPWIADVRPGDPVQGGVLMRTTRRAAPVLRHVRRHARARSA